jgi:hypothetical protein
LQDVRAFAVSFLQLMSFSETFVKVPRWFAEGGCRAVFVSVQDVGKNG